MKIGVLEIAIIALVLLIVVVIVLVVVLVSRRTGAGQQVVQGVTPKFCPNCGHPLQEHANFCMQCRADIKPQTQTTTPPAGPSYAAAVSSTKSTGIAVALAIVPAFLGFYGIGQMYMERIGRGLAILFADWVITGIGIALLILGWSREDFGLVVLVIVLGLASLALFIWQIVDAASLAHQWNRHIAQTGQRPW